jgi:ABC-type Fe3+ transport system permease subunit
MVDATLDKINKYVPEKWRWVLSHGGFRRYFKNTGWMFVGQAFNIVSVIVGIWVARYLGPENFGVF